MCLFSQQLEFNAYFQRDRKSYFGYTVYKMSNQYDPKSDIFRGQLK